MFSFALTPYASGKELPRDQIVNFNGTIDNEYIVGNARTIISSAVVVMTYC